ncbi:hypothetical protein BDQ12DRAFT_594416 [Crucibulum laeve]|uniref:F-box domain-containing protein n=1 Tax=Crucibulum laeve TaxID=68775 RepID=A0A5C3MJI0_9AGAR|nr:hypothetical protein BDQ12DRAFT_594416 [Crucibulum laeve]
MSKHSLSPAPLPPSKRLHALSSSTRRGDALQPFSFNDSLYDELILCIFSHLSWVDLCSVQPTNRNWARLAADNELWRKLYLRVYGRTRLRGARGFISRADGREVKPLPGRAKTDDFKDWKWMFRISSNWRKGRCTVEKIVSEPPPIPQDDLELPYQTHILLAGTLTITASSHPSSLPLVRISSLRDSEHNLVCESKHAGSCQITALAMDQSPPSSGQLRIASFLSTGEFFVFLVNHSHGKPSSPSKKLVYVPARQSNRTSPIIQAVYHHPLLITLSQAFTLSLYDLSSDTIKHTQTLSSYTSFPPSSLVLSNPTPTTYKLVLAYATPVYPAHWSVGATELIISGSSSSPSPTFSQQISDPILEPMTVQTTRTIRTLEVPPGWMDDSKLRSMREQWSRKVSCVADTQTDGKWLVLAPGNSSSSSPSSSSSYHGSTSSFPPSSSLFSGSYSSSSGVASSPSHSSTNLQLYRLSLPASSSSVSSSPPKLTFVRSLHGQIGPISALALADGRCVSLGSNGSIWVWDLEGGTGAEVAVSSELASSIGYDGHLAKGNVCFDERRIITATGGNILVRRFDI